MKYLLTLIVAFFTLQAYSQYGDIYAPFEKHNIKLFPHYTQSKFIGAGIAYETTLGIRFLTTQLSYRYSVGIKDTSNQYIKSKHHKVELQTRLWLLENGEYFYVAPAFSAYSGNYFSGALLLGFQVLIHRHFVLDANLGVQSNNGDESVNISIHKQPIFSRATFSIGYQFITEKKVKPNKPL